MFETYHVNSARGKYLRLSTTVYLSMRLIWQVSEFNLSTTVYLRLSTTVRQRPSLPTPPSHRSQEEDTDYQRWLGMSEYEFSSPSGYAHNTYHGPSRHARPALVLEPKPIRFTDSPQHFVSGPAALPPTQPPPRRKSSSASNDSEVRVWVVRWGVVVVRVVACDEEEG